MKFRHPVKFDVSAYKLIQMSERFKKIRGPYMLQKAHLSGQSFSYFVWDITHYNDEKLIGTRLISHYHVRTRSIMFE